MKTALQHTDRPSDVGKIMESLQDNNTQLNIAITGESGSGKSTFVNALRELSDGDEGAAPTGVTETTSEVTPYPHPNYPNVTFWDLPGIGTTKFPPDKYLELVGFEKFDFFIIVSADRFRENDVKLSQEIQRMEKKFYFVRSKIDNDLRAERRKRNFSEEETLRKMREDCIQGLGVESPQVFLVSSFELHLYDFSLLHETLDRDLPEHKRHALLRAMPNISLDIIDTKKKTFKHRLYWLSALSAAVAAVPVPGLSIAVDIAVLVGAVTDYVFGFGVDIKSLQRLSASTGVPYADLRAVIVSPLSLSPAACPGLRGSLPPLFLASSKAPRGVPSALLSAATRKVLRQLQRITRKHVHTAFRTSVGLWL
ncbi:unnamed protein product [Oreochromis niloticus]|nr:unnamed protein product [Mustela putorius furo]